MGRMLLKWKKSLTSEVDCNGSTPLHFLSSQLNHILPLNASRWPIRTLLEANPAAMYQPDNSGMFPIHVAASVGAHATITRFIGERRTEDSEIRLPNSIFSLDFEYARHRWEHCTALGCTGWVHVTLANKKGRTPLDVAYFNCPPVWDSLGLIYRENSQSIIGFGLDICGAKHGSCRWDHFRQTYIKEQGHDYQRKELEKLKDSTQTLCIGSVLIATMAFGATFALPGGYRADDHTNGGTPTLAGRYTFDALMIANALAFICSLGATIGLLFSGLHMVEFKSRAVYFMTSTYLVGTSITSLTAAFALGVYMVLAPVAHKTAVAISVMGPLVMVHAQMEMYLKWAHLVQPLCSRFGKTIVLTEIPCLIILGLLSSYWPILVIFCWPAIARNH
ncbi:hypothetical protein EJB05_01171, partial [Eragrostis curvula]